MSFHFIWVNTKALTHQAGNWKSSKALFFKFLENYNTMVKSSAGYIVQPPHLKLKSEQISPLWGTRFPSFSELLFSIHWVLFIRQDKKITFFFWFLESRIYFAILTDHFSSKKWKGIRNLYFYISIYHVLLCLFQIQVQVHQPRMWNHIEKALSKLVSVPTLYLKNKLRR